MEEKKKAKKILTLAIVVLLVTFLIVIFGMVVIGVIYLIVKTKSEPSKKVKFHDYKLTTVDLNSNEKSQGFVSLPIDLQGDEFISYQSENGEYSVVSNFGPREFLCRVKCTYSVPDEEMGERRGDALVMRSIFISLVVIATTLVAAIWYTKKNSDEECLKQDPESLDEFLSSVMDDCGPVFEGNPEDLLECSVKVKCALPRGFNESTNERSVEEQREFCEDQGWEFFENIDIKEAEFQGDEEDEERVENWLANASAQMIQGCKQLGCSNHMHYYICGGKSKKAKDVSFSGEFEFR